MSHNAPTHRAIPLDSATPLSLSYITPLCHCHYLSTHPTPSLTTPPTYCSPGSHSNHIPATRSDTARITTTDPPLELHLTQLSAHSPLLLLIGVYAMPLTKDERIVKLAEDIIATFDGIFGRHPGHRPAHAKGGLYQGTFTPTPEAASLSTAAHFNHPSTPVFVRFSNSTGLPQLPDTSTDPQADPRGIAIRFMLGERVHTDIVAHSANGFPTRTGQEFLELLKALVASGAPDAPKPKPIEVFLGSHPAALRFVQLPKPAPVSFAQEQYFALSAFKFTSQAGKTHFGRYIIVPAAGVEHMDNETLAKQTPNFLFDELTTRVRKSPAVFHIDLQLAEDGDVTDDVTVHWPADRKVVRLGTLTLEAAVADDATAMQRIIFDPIPRTEGIEASDDPLLEFRAAVYIISGKRRRADPPVA